MSGGSWGYKQWELEDLAEQQLDPRYRQLLQAVARSEHIVDWAESGDTVRHREEDGSGAERELYDLWLKTFNEVFGE